MLSYELLLLLLTALSTAFAVLSTRRAAAERETCAEIAKSIRGATTELNALRTDIDQCTFRLRKLAGTVYQRAQHQRDGDDGAPGPVASEGDANPDVQAFIALQRASTP